MKIIKLYTALLSLSISLNVYALGLGELHVHSSLDQPFDAEIELLDVGNHPLSGIKANLGSVEDYQRVGLERSFGLGDLSFTVEKNKQGQAIIKIHSMQRVSDPFIQLLVDLAWSKGLIYREYSVLLDPPHYDLVVTQRMKHVVQRRDHTEPGVVDKVVNEEGGPTHDWRSKQPISSPDVEQNVSYESQLPAVPELPRSEYAIPPINTFLSADQDVVPSLRPFISTNVEGNPAIKSQMDVAVSVIDSVRESNALMKEQIELLRAQNKNLQDQLNKHNAEVAALHAQLNLLIRRQGIAGQVITFSENDHHSHLWIWALLLIGLGGAYIGCRKWRIIEFVTEPALEKKPATRSVKMKQSAAVRSKVALEAILTLAKTYIDMGDIAAAKESLQEVIDYGNKKQQEAAKALMSGLKL